MQWILGKSLEKPFRLEIICENLINKTIYTFVWFLTNFDVYSLYFFFIKARNEFVLSQMWLLNTKLLKLKELFSDKEGWRTDGNTYLICYIICRLWNLKKMSGFIHNGHFLKAKISIDNYISKTKLHIKKYVVLKMLTYYLIFIL